MTAMGTDQTFAGREPLVLAAREGDHYHFLDHLATVKVAAGTDRSMSVVEFLAPEGFGPPLHRHDHEDELFVVLDGELVFHLGGERLAGGPGAVAFLPRAVPHTFQVVSVTARFVTLTASPDGPPRLDRMVADLGASTPSPTLPEPGGVDPSEVAAVCARHGIAILGPPPVAAASIPGSRR